MYTTDDLINFIKVAHAGQVDKGAGKPYWEHPVAVMNTLPPFASDDLKAAALLHDVIEDTAFVRKGNALVFDKEKFTILDETMRLAKRPTEILLARVRNEPDPENTPPVLRSPELSTHTLGIVEGVTNEEYQAPPGADKQEVERLMLAHYHHHIAELANNRPENPDGIRLAEDRVLLKFADMSQNVDKDRVMALGNAEKAARFANKYSEPFKALLLRAKEIAQKNGYELQAKTVLEDDGQGNKRFYLEQPPQWMQLLRDSNRADGKTWENSLGDRPGRTLGK